jgi:pyruvate/2-oxoglutarate dehydrogenase complex dihydrolipoamide dehydrogenase (E3) component
VLIGGGGETGAETADFLAEYGHAITVLEMKSAIVEEMQYVHRMALLERLARNKVEIITGATVRRFVDGGVICERGGGRETLAGFDDVVLAMGAVAYNPLGDALKDKVAEIHVIGDAVKARSAKEANEEASRVAVAV